MTGKVCTKKEALWWSQVCPVNCLRLVTGRVWASGQKLAAGNLYKERDQVCRLSGFWLVVSRVLDAIQSLVDKG